jgi:hypothetical protein
MIAHRAKLRKLASCNVHTSLPDFSPPRTRADANTFIIKRAKAGKLVQIVVIRVSPDGKTRTVTTTGINAKDQPLDNIAFFEKQ